MNIISNYNSLSRIFHLAKSLIVASCYLCCYSYIIVSYTFTNYLGKIDFYKIHTTHKFLGIILLIVIVLGLANTVKNGFAFQATDTWFEKLAKRVFFSLMYLVLFAIVFSGILANYEPNIIFVKVPILLEGLSVKLLFYKMHIGIVKFLLPTVLLMHSSMALVGFLIKKDTMQKCLEKIKKQKILLCIKNSCKKGFSN